MPDDRFPARPGPHGRHVDPHGGPPGRPHGGPGAGPRAGAGASLPAGTGAVTSPGPGCGLGDLPPALAEALLAAGQRRTWRRGQTVLRQGQPSGVLTVCLSGKLAAVLQGADGHDTLLRWLEAGELVGLADVLAGLPSPAQLVAHGASQTLHLDRARFIALLREQPDGAIAVAELLSRRLCELFRFIEQSSARPLADRVAFALQRLAATHGERDANGRTVLKVTQGELAMAAGASRQRVHAELKRLAAAGRLSLGYGRVTLHPPGPCAPAPADGLPAARA